MACPTWTEVISPLAQKLELAAKLDMQLVEGPEGCKAMATLYREMARLLDEEVTRRKDHATRRNALQRWWRQRNPSR